MNKKYLSIVLLIIMLASILSGCYDAMEIDDDLYPIILGVDIGKQNMVRNTIQYPNYKSDSGSGGASAGGKMNGGTEKNVSEGNNIESIESPTVLEGLYMFSMTLSRRVSLMHTKLLIISEEFAKLGIQGYMAGFERFRETRTTMSLLISKGRAEDFIMENKTNIGTSLSKSVELLLGQTSITGFFPRVRFFDFYKDMLSTYRQPVALYGGVNQLNNIDGISDKTKVIEAGKGYLPGEIPRKGTSKVEIAGISVFNGGKMVGALDSYETTYYMMLTGEYKKGRVSIQDKYDPTKAIVFDMHTSRKPKVKASMQDGKPVIDLNIKLEAEIYVIQSRIDYEELPLTQDAKKQIEDFLSKGMKATIKKTQEEFHTDIFGFGEWMAGNFFTIEDWESYNWLAHYPEAAVNLNLSVDIRRTGLIFNSAPIHSNEGIKGESR
jgi:spore germination protein KC